METAATNSTTISWTGITVDAKGSSPVKTPTELLVTRSVETKDGWMGQIVMAGKIIWESLDRFEKGEEALGAANTQVHEAFKRLIVGTNAPESGVKAPGGYA